MTPSLYIKDLGARVCMCVCKAQESGFHRFSGNSGASMEIELRLAWNAYLAHSSATHGKMGTWMVGALCNLGQGSFDTTVDTNHVVWSFL